MPTLQDLLVARQGIDAAAAKLDADFDAFAGLGAALAQSQANLVVAQADVTAKQTDLQKGQQSAIDDLSGLKSAVSVYEAQLSAFLNPQPAPAPAPVPAPAPTDPQTPATVSQ